MGKSGTEPSYDCIIIGAGPAGISAAIYTARAKLKTLMIGKHRDGALFKAHHVANYFGFDKGIEGPELVERAVKQAQNLGAGVVEDEVVNIVQDKKKFVLKTSDGSFYTARSVIIASGTAYKIAGAKNEQELSGKGVHYCVVCDGYWYNQKKVAVLGAANHAAEEAIALLDYTKDITLFSNGVSFSIAPALMQHLEKNNLKLRNEKVLSFDGKNKLEYLQLENGQKEKFDGVFVAMGVTTALNFASKIGLNTERNYIVVDRECRTSVEGVYAAGNCIGGGAQAAISVGQGCTAALSVIKHLRGVDVYIDYG